MGNKKSTAKKSTAKEKTSKAKTANGAVAKQSDADKIIQDIRIKLISEYGDNVVMTGADIRKCSYGRIRTGCLPLDIASGGGFPIGRMIQIAGDKSTSKSTLCNHIIASAQKTIVEWIWTHRTVEKGREVVEEIPKRVEGLICGYNDVEGTNTDEWATQIGVDTSRWVYTQPSSIGEAFDMSVSMAEKGVHLIIIDSVDALETANDQEKTMDESRQQAVKPTIIGRFCRRMTNLNNRLRREGKLPCTVVFINQIREKPMAMGD